MNNNIEVKVKQNNNNPEDLYLERYKDILLSGKAKKCTGCKCITLGRLPEEELLCYFCWLIENNYISNKA